MQDAITALQTEIVGWATPLTTAVLAVLGAFVVITGIYIAFRLLVKSANRAAK